MPRRVVGGARDLAGIVIEQRGAAPRGGGGRLGEYLPEPLARVHGVGVVLLRRRQRVQPRAQGGHGLRVGAAAGQRAHRIGRRAVPVGVERAGDLAHDGAVRQHVQIAEADVGRGAEVLVADIAPADDGGLVIGNQRLVVHAPVHARELQQRAGTPEGAAGHRVEDAHLDGWMGVHGQQQVVVGAHADVVQQHPHTHAPVCRAQHGVGQGSAGGVVVPDVVLEVERALGLFRQQHPGDQRVDVVRQQVEGALVWRVRATLRGKAAERGLSGVCHRVARFAVCRGQAGAGGQQGGCRHRDHCYPGQRARGSGHAGLPGKDRPPAPAKSKGQYKMAPAKPKMGMLAPGKASVTATQSGAKNIVRHRGDCKPLPGERRQPWLVGSSD
ncbi:hypothetical protein D3C87_1135070 [compost metagenome]